jgi:hypothetical protein
LRQRWVTAALILVLTTSLFAPVYAHTTLGNLTGSNGYFRSNDHELNPTNTFGAAHVPGPLGYVWPGSGLDMYTGNPSNPPGYQSPFEDYEQPAQEAANAYAPEGAILASTSDHDSVGDLIFAINFSQPHAFPHPGNFKYSTLALYIPAPVFDKTGKLIQDGFEPAAGINWDSGENTNIVTTITDNYGNIFVTRADRNDPFEPGSWIVFITAPNNIAFTSARGWSEWYYIRINQMKAPQVAGRYFFKMFLDNHFPVHRQGALPKLVNSTMPMENWPVLLVKGEVDPAIISGTVRFGDHSNSDFYGLPLKLPGMVRAVGIATDPITGQLTGRAVEARGYFNATSQGHFEIEGVAPGIYDMYASAAGFPEQQFQTDVKIGRGQSLSFDAYLKAGPQIGGRVYSKALFGSLPWPGQLPISIVIYNSNSYDTDSIVTYSPANLTHAPFTSYVRGNTMFAGSRLSAPNTPRTVAFPWEGPNSYYTLTPAPTFKDPFGLFNGVGPAQPWWVDPTGNTNPSTSLGSSSSDFTFQFGSEGSYGAPAQFSGMVPQVFATWTDSLTPGRYYVRVYVNGYIQTTADGTSFVDYSFDLPENEFSTNVFLPIDLEKSPAISVLIHFHDEDGTIVDAPVGGPDPSRFLIAEAFASDGTLAALNFTQVTSSSSQATITLDGLGMAGPILPPDPRAFVKYSLARYQGLYDYGLPTDTYTVRVFMRGYIQALPPATSFEELDQPLATSLSIGVGTATISTHMYRGGEINATLQSVDWERPAVSRNWVWNNAAVSALIYDVSSRNFIDVIYFWNSKLNQWVLPTQNSKFKNLPWSSWRTTFGSGASLLVTNGSTLVDRFGPDVPSLKSLDPAQDEATTVFLEENFHTGFLYSPSSYRTSSFRSALAIYPGVYALNGWTYGYVQDNVASLGDLGNVLVSVSWLGSMADTHIQLIVGLNLTIRMVFKTENIFSGVPFNSSVRIRVFDDGDTLVAATTLFSDAGTLNPTSSAGLFADGTKLLQRPVPQGTGTLQYANLAGLYSYVEPSSGPTNLGISAGVRSATLFSPDHGIWGASDHPGAYGGGWTVMVDFVNWSTLKKNYPPVPGLLQGESPYFFPYNHLGPFRQATFPRISNAPQGGEASDEFELDLRGYVSGLILGMDWDQDARTLSWTSIAFNSGSTSLYWYTWDGFFDGYLDPGSYHATITEWTNANEGHLSRSLDLSVSLGQANNLANIVLDESGIAIPESPSSYVMLLATFALSVLVLRIRWKRRRK